MEIVVLAGPYNNHHFKNLEHHFEGRFVYVNSYNPEIILEHNPHLVICFDEHWCELGQLMGQLKRGGKATLQIMDGVLEWRRTWDYGWEGHRVDGVINPINQPVLSHKIACLGRRDARIMESWGNFGKCEVVGAPRLDHLVQKRLAGEIPKVGGAERRRRILVMTAKKPGFTAEQVRITKNALIDLKAFFTRCPDIDVIWRLTRGLDEELGVRNTLSDLAGLEFHQLLEDVDAVITTPSTSLLEAMLMDRPVALLDYHNTPHYFEAAWSIFCEKHIEPVITELLSPPPEKMDFQQFLLEEQLASKSPAVPRLIRLIEAMLEVVKSASGGNYEFPTRIIDDQDLFVNSVLPLSQMRRYYPMLPVPDDIELRELKIELAAAKGTIQNLYDERDHLVRRLNSIPGYSMLKKLRKALHR